jgi:predicted nucleic acid-binding protein
MQPLLPDADIWFRAFSRQDPDPMVVHAFGRNVRERRIYLMGWVRQGLLARVRDERQFTRLAWVLSAFPDLPLLPRDHEQAAQITRRMRELQVPTSPWSALVWAVAIRLDGAVWSRERHWQALQSFGCPLHRGQ